MTVRRRASLLTPAQAAPSAEEIAARPELLKQMLQTASDNVYEHDIDMAVLVAFTPDGTPKIYHTYGRDLSMTEVARLFADISTMARKLSRK